MVENDFISYYIVIFFLYLCRKIKDYYGKKDISDIDML